MRATFRKLFAIQTRRRNTLVAIQDELVLEGYCPRMNKEKIEQHLAILKDNMDTDTELLQRFYYI